MKNIFILLSVLIIAGFFNACSSKEDFKPLYQSKAEITKVKD